MRPPKPALLYAGIVIAAAGFALIAFTWSQVAPLESVALQLPYLVSGGLTGLGLVIVGATAVNVHAKRREGAERERQTQQLLEVLRQVTAALDDAPPTDAAEGDADGAWERPGAPEGNGDANPGHATSDEGEDATEDLLWQR